MAKVDLLYSTHAHEMRGLFENVEMKMEDILRTLTRQEIDKARALSNNEGPLASDCYQLLRYWKGQIFYRADAERGLIKIREAA